MISTTLRDDALMDAIFSTTWSTTAPPREATCEAESASWLACRALSAFCLTVEVSSCIDAAVSSSELACASVRDDRSRLPEAIWLDALAIESVPSRTWPTTLASSSFMARSARISMPDSEVSATSMRAVRSPDATCCATVTACPSGRVMERVMRNASSSPPSSDAQLIDRMIHLAR